MPGRTDFEALLQSFQSRKFQVLRPAQAHILIGYNDFLDKSDVAIELPTGSGKTLIALLIAEVWRRERKKIAILSANKTLARQMVQEAAALGVPAVLMEGSRSDIPSPDRRAYQRAQKIAVMNYWVYFNQNPAIDPADLLVMDDAHLAEHCLHSLYSVEIDKVRHNDLFRQLIGELRERFPEYSVLSDALADDSPADSPPELLSFLDQVDFADRARELIDSSAYLQTDPDLRFRWTRLRNGLKEANIYVSLTSVWIRPYVYPLTSNDHYGHVQQRLYTSATIGDPSDLSRRLGTRPVAKIPVRPEYAQQTYGRRLIVMNRLDDKDIPRRLQVVILTALRIHPKSVWLCASHTEAARLQQSVSRWLEANGFTGHPAWVLSPLGNEIEEFKQSPLGHLFVAGRFDGMDFSADECRLVVVKTLPRAINSQEQFISAYLRDSGFMRRRLNQRIVQALGRCNRSEGDFGVYVLADRRFATHFGRESNREGIPANMVAEIDMAQDHAEIEEGELRAEVENFLNSDFTRFDDAIRQYRAQVPPGAQVVVGPDTSVDEVVGWTALFASQNYPVAAERFKKCLEATRQANLREIAAFHGWNWAKALYLESVLGEASAKERSLQVFEDAVTRGGRSSWFNRMRASLNRARRVPSGSPIAAEYAEVLLRAFDELLERVGTAGNRFDKWCEGVTTGVQSEHHDQFTEALEKLGDVLGYRASRPKYQAAPDCHWRGLFGNQREVITLEAKIEHMARTAISPGDVGQAHIQLARAQAEFQTQGYVIRGAIITHLDAIESAADASAGVLRVIPKTAIVELWERVRLLLSLYRDAWSVDDIQARWAAAGRIRPRLPQSGWLIRALDCRERFITAQGLLAEWG